MTSQINISLIYKHAVAEMESATLSKSTGGLYYGAKQVIKLLHPKLNKNFHLH